MLYNMLKSLNPYGLSCILQIFTGLERLLEKSIPVGNDNLTWTLLKYKKTEVHNRSKLNVVIKLLHECFNPVKEPLTQRDIVEDVIFCKG